MTNGLAQHCHHDKLFEYCFDLGERQQAIRDTKPANEQALRLRLFRIIPDDRLPADLVKLNTQGGELYAQRDKLYAQRDKLYAQRNKLYAQRNKLYAQREKLYAQWEKVNTQGGKRNTQREKLYAQQEKVTAQLFKLNTQGGELYVQRNKLYAQWEKLLMKYRPELEALHSEFCPDCPWDGETIFTRKGADGNWY